MMRFKDIDSERDELDRCRRYLANDLVNAANNTSRTVQLKEMLSVPVNPDSVSENGKNGLCRAAFEGYKSHGRLLLEAGADPNLVEPHSGYTPLVATLVGGNPELIELLLLAGADPTIPDAEGETALQAMETLVGEGTMNIARSIAARKAADVSMREIRGLLVFSAISDGTKS